MSEVDDELAALELARATAAKERKGERNKQRLADLKERSELELVHGVENVLAICVDGEDGSRYMPGLPTMALFKAPTEILIKRFRAQSRPPKGEDADPEQLSQAMILLGLSCLIYPEREVWDRMLARRPGLDTQAGTLVAKLAVGKADADLKD